MPAQSPMDQLRAEAWDRALHADGTAYLFQQRARFYSGLLKISAFLGIVLPLVVGAVALAGFTSHLGVVTAVAGLLGIPVVVISAWSLVADWTGAHQAAIQSESANHRLSEDYTELAGNPPSGAPEFRHRLQLIKAQDSAQQDRDRGQHVTDAELRRGMRAALRNRQKACAECNLKPTTMVPTDCGVCGEFPKQWWRR